MALTAADKHYLRYQKKYGGIIKVRPDFTKCAAEVDVSAKWNESHQCNRKCGHGPEGAYCKQHASKINN